MATAAKCMGVCLRKFAPSRNAKAGSGRKRFEKSPKKNAGRQTMRKHLDSGCKQKKDFSTKATKQACR